MFLKGEGDRAGAEEEDGEEDFDWQVEQEVCEETPQEEPGATQPYGFGNRRCGVFARLQVRLSPPSLPPSGIPAAELPGLSFAGGTERRDGREEPGANDGGGAEEGPAGGGSLGLLRGSLPVSRAGRRVPSAGADGPPLRLRADLFEDEEIQGLLKFVPWWAKPRPSAGRPGDAGELKRSGGTER